MSALAVLSEEQIQQIIAKTVAATVEKLPLVEPRQVFNLDQAAEFLDRHPQVVMKFVREKRLVAHFISRREPRFYRKDLLAFLDSLPQEPKET